MKIKPEEISSIIRKQIEDYKKRTDTAEVGTVIEAGDGLTGLELDAPDDWRDPEGALKTELRIDVNRKTPMIE